MSSSRVKTFASILVAHACLTAHAQQLPVLPYTQRTHPYSGYSAVARGDIRTVGMAGATIGLGDTFIAITDNPAGLAMTLNNADANYSSNKIHDGNVQNFGSIIETSNLGAAMTMYPWGISAGYVQPYQEGQRYSLALTPSDDADLRVRTREFHLGVARVLNHDRLSLGVDLVFGQAESRMVFTRHTALNARDQSYIVIPPHIDGLFTSVVEG